MSGVETENIDESKATASESEYSDDNNEKTERIYLFYSFILF